MSNNIIIENLIRDYETLASAHPWLTVGDYSLFRDMAGKACNTSLLAGNERPKSEPVPVKAVTREVVPDTIETHPETNTYIQDEPEEGLSAIDIFKNMGDD